VLARRKQSEALEQEAARPRGRIADLERMPVRTGKFVPGGRSAGCLAARGNERFSPGNKKWGVASLIRKAYVSC